MGMTLFRCGRCGKRYANPLTHTCVTRLDRRRKPGKTRLQPRGSRACRTCGKPYANPLTHVCTVKTGFRKRHAAARRRATAERKRQKAAERRAAAKARRQAAAARRRAAAKARQAEARRKAAEAKQRKPATPGGSRPRGDSGHDYRECFYDSQPDRGRAARDCARFPCRVYREGHEHGYTDGRSAGHGQGYAAGYQHGAAEASPS